MKGRVNKMWYIHLVEGVLDLKRKGILIHATVRRKLGDIMLSEINQKQKDKYFMIHLNESPRRSQIHRSRKGCQGLIGREMRSCYLVGRE